MDRIADPWGSRTPHGSGEQWPVRVDEHSSILWEMVGQAAQAARDEELLGLVRECHAETELQVKWLVTRIKLAAPQALATD